MAGRIPRAFIDELLARVDIVDVVDDYVPLKKAGKDHKACCPFHNEKTPSFTVSGDKQFYHCFGCGAHGTVIGFLMEYAHMDFVEAVEELAGRVGLEVPREQGAGAPADALAPLYEVLEKASAYYQTQLREHPEAPRAVAYLKGRGLSGEIAAEFKLGFAPAGWDNLAKGLGRDEAARRLLERAGLLVERQGGGAYDRFRGRIMFPILDRRGRTVGFGGRVLGDDSPKYLNSPETPVFHKGRELYGLFQARKAAAKLERLIVVEGYMDVVALAQAGIHNAVATLGTAATTKHIEQLFRVCRDLVFCFDGDEAGRRAAWRALETALPAMREGRQAFFMFLPEGEDPDSLVRARGRGGFEEAVAGAESLGTFLFQHLEAEVDRSTIDGRSRLVALARPLIDKIPPGPFRELASRQLGELTGLPTENSATLSPGRGSTTASRPPAFPGQSRRQSPSLVRRVVTLLLHHPQLGRSADDVSHLRRLALPGVPLLIELLETLEESPELTMAGLVERFRDHEAGRHLARLAAEEAATLDEALEQEFRDSLRRLRVLADDERFRELASKARAARLSADERREFARLSRGANGAEEGSVETPGPGKGT